MNYFSRIFAPDVFQPCAKDFDQRVFETFSSKLALPPLNDVAREQVSLPVFLGGFGLRSMYHVSPVAYWCALSQYYHLISPLVPSPDVLLADSKVPFVQSLYKCHTLLLDFHIKLPRPTPPRPENFFCDFKDTPAAASDQRKLLLAINASRLKTLISLLLGRLLTELDSIAYQINNLAPGFLLPLFLPFFLYQTSPLQ